MLTKANEVMNLPVGLQFLLGAMETEFQHLSFQVWLLHTLRTVLFTIVSKVAVKRWKTPVWVANKANIMLEVTKVFS